MTAERPSTFFSYFENHSDEVQGMPMAFRMSLLLARRMRAGGNCFPSCTFQDRFPWFVDTSGADVTDTHRMENPSSRNVSSNPEQNCSRVRVNWKLRGRRDQFPVPLGISGFLTSRNVTPGQRVWFCPGRFRRPVSFSGRFGIQRPSMSTSLEPDAKSPPVLRAQSLSVARVVSPSSVSNEIRRVDRLRRQS